MTEIFDREKILGSSFLYWDLIHGLLRRDEFADRGINNHDDTRDEPSAVVLDLINLWCHAFSAIWTAEKEQTT